MRQMEQAIGQTSGVEDGETNGTGDKRNKEARNMVKRIVLVTAVAVLVAGAPAQAAVDPGDLCKEGKD